MGKSIFKLSNCSKISANFVSRDATNLTAPWNLSFTVRPGILCNAFDAISWTSPLPAWISTSAPSPNFDFKCCCLNYSVISNSNNILKWGIQYEYTQTQRKEGSRYVIFILLGNKNIMSTYPPIHLNFPFTIIANLLQRAAHSSIEWEVKRTAAPTFWAP